MKRFVLIGILLMIAATMFVFGKSATTSPTALTADKKDEMTHLAKKRFNLKKDEGLNFTNGPCLGVIAPGWVVDIAHNPRQPSDDEAQNQCAEYRQKTVQHMVELDTNGNVIQVK